MNTEHKSMHQTSPYHPQHLVINTGTTTLILRQDLWQQWAAKKCHCRWATVLSRVRRENLISLTSSSEYKVFLQVFTSLPVLHRENKLFRNCQSPGLMRSAPVVEPPGVRRASLPAAHRFLNPEWGGGGVPLYKHTLCMNSAHTHELRLHGNVEVNVWESC